MTGMTTEGQQRVIETIVEAIVPVIEAAIARRSEEIFGTVESLRQEVAEAVGQIRDTASVLHDNDVALLARVMAGDGNEVAEFARVAGDAWARFVRSECEQLGWRVVVPK